MTNRATLAEVQKVLSTSVTDITPFATTAHELVEEVVVGGTPTLDEERLTLIEVWLTAHFVTVFEPVTKQEAAGPVSATYHGQTSYMLKASIHGQTAILLDTTFGLAALHNDAMNPDKTNLKPSVTWLGTSQLL